MGIINLINDLLWTYILVALLLGCAVWFTLRTRFVQFRMIKEMVRLLGDSGGKGDAKEKHISSFQAFAISIASRVGTGNLAGVATAIAVGGPGAVFWMWVIALLGASSSFVESTLAQLYKIKGKDSFIGGPAYYMRKGLKQPWMGALFAVLITITFGFAFNSVQSNTLCAAFEGAFGFDHAVVGGIITALTLTIIFGGVQRIAKVSSIIVPIMALGYIALALIIVLLNIKELPGVLALIVGHAFGWEQALGGGCRHGADAGHQTRAVQQRGRYGVRPQCGGNRTRQPPREARLDSDAGSIYRYADYMYLHRFHHSVQRCSTGWFHKRRTAYPACTDQRDRTFGSHLRCGSLVLLRIQQHSGKLLLRRSQCALPYPL